MDLYVVYRHTLRANEALRVHTIFHLMEHLASFNLILLLWHHLSHLGIVQENAHQHFYATTSRLPLHKLLEDLTWIGNPNSSDVPPLRAALHQNVLGTDDVVEILEYLVDQNPEWLRARSQDGSLHST
jgi:hypothetical protein